MWPDVTDYERNGATLHQTAFDSLGDGRPAMLYNMFDREIIFTHFEWMNEYGLDVYADYRFPQEVIGNNVISTIGNRFNTIMDAAENFGRSFYVAYDMTNCVNIVSDQKSELLRKWKTDWIINVEQSGAVSSPSYAHAEGKPVVLIYGLHGSDVFGDYFDDLASEEDINLWLPVEVASEMIQWLRNRGYYVIGATPGDPCNWLYHSDETQALYSSVDMLAIWMDYEPTLTLEFINAHKRSWADNKPISFMPMTYPGFSWTAIGLFPGEPNGIARRAGEFMWERAYKALKDSSVQTLFFGLVNESHEALVLLKSARDFFDVPEGQWFLTHSADGWWLSSDYYLRTAGAISEMIRDRSLLRPEIDIPHSLGPIYWRNSFEMRDARAIVDDGRGNLQIESRPNQRIDPCLNNPAQLTDKGSGVTLATNAIIKTAGRSGDFAFHLAGSGNGSVYYKIADTKINAVSDKLELRYSLRPVNTGGQNVFVDILFEDGSLFSEHSEGIIAARGIVNTWTDVRVTIPPELTAKRISGIVVGYSGSGSFSAYVDDIIIQEPTSP
jgi:hypothetical protein